MSSGARCSVVDRTGTRAEGNVNPGRVPLERSVLLTSVSTLGSCRDVFAASTDQLIYHQRPSDGGVSDELSGAELRGRRAWKNLVVLGVAFMFLFSALVSLHSVQSSLDPHSGVGVLSLSCVHGAAVVSCLLAPVVIARLTTKWTIVASAGACLVYAVVANVHPRDFTLVPSSLLLGLFTGPMWSAQAVHLSRLAVDHADAARLDPDVTLARFNGVFGGLFALSQVWGHVLSAVVLVDAEVETGPRLPPVNESHVHSVCGAIPADCGRLDGVVSDRVALTARHLRPVTASTRQLLLSAHVGCIVVALALTASLLDGAGHPRPNKGSSVAMFGALKALGDPRLILLVPLVVFVGLEQGFVLADFTKNCGVAVSQ
ncbi:hypothetical protein NP493_165g05011 [Ridgeia piscesae]|uniref:Uncharacterized protein n=1 Tax=Ridgeia piscesae TaxID=27915 RepID=A0AAD9P3G6_RIDPI|nr:hypothetical protein NP493_165g05011 [Ridgeia piscesae]